MPRLTISVKNAKLVSKNLQDLRAEIPKISKHHLQALGKRVVKQMRVYPPQHTGSAYVRTYRLKNSWKATDTAKGIVITGDPVYRGKRYGVFVVGSEKGTGQAWMHVGNWLLFRDVFDYEMTKVPDAVESSLRYFAKRKGLT